MNMYNPAHPGEIFKELIMEPLGLSDTEAAYHLGVKWEILYNMINGHSAITPEMALRIEMTFGKPNAQHWLRLQNAYDLWQAMQHSVDIQVTPLERCAA